MPDEYNVKKKKLSFKGETKTYGYTSKQEEQSLQAKKRSAIKNQQRLMRDFRDTNQPSIACFSD